MNFSGRGGQRDVALAGEQAAGGIEADPAGAGQVHLAPGVQVGEIRRRAAGSVERFDIGGELDQAAAHEAGGQPQVPEQLAQQPGRVPARAAAQLERFFGRLHARFQPDQIAEVAPEPLVDLHERIDRARTRIAGRRGRTS
jgi:hypothetical protein